MVTRKTEIVEKKRFTFSYEGRGYIVVLYDAEGGY